MLSNKELGKYLKDSRNAKGLSLRQVNKISDISYSHLNMIENGKRNVTPALLKNLAKLYGLDYIDLYEKAGYIDLIEDEKKDMLKKIGAIPLSEIETTKIPVLGKVKAGYNYLAQENIIDYIAFNIDGADKENYYALYVIGDSMEPLFDDGDIVIVHKQDDFNNGDNCVILINGEEATIKKVYKGTTDIKLQAVNPYYPPRIFTEDEIKNLPVKVIGVVEKSIRNFKKK